MKVGIITAIAATTVWVACSAPALAQGRSADPNMGHFYMARQQWQILDDAPQVYDKRTDPAAVNPQSGLPRGPAPLPRAGFNSYTSAMPTGMSAGLPQVFNGVPKKLPPPAPVMVRAKSAKAGAYKPPGKTAARPSGPVAAKTYAPYQGYGGGGGPVSSGPTPGNGSYGQSGVSSSTGVRGNLLHWSRTGRSY